jgi:hypothetical protein
MATIKIKRKTTAGGSAPTNEGEISCNTFDKELFVGDGTNAIKFIDTLAVDQKITNALTSALEYKGTVVPNAEGTAITDATLYIITDVGTQVLGDFPGALNLAVGEVFTSSGTSTLSNGGSVQEIKELPVGAKGDYYKVTTQSGYVIKNGATSGEIYVNANDSLLYDGTNWDIVDNTNSTVASSAGSITVSGSTDAGFNVEVNIVDGGTY